MKTLTRYTLCSVLFAAGSLFGQSSSTNPNPQDVPTQQPGTNSPDVAKDHKTDTGSGSGTATPAKTHNNKKNKRKSVTDTSTSTTP